MRLISPRAWLLVILSACLQIFMFPTGGPMPTWRAAICWFALVPFLYALMLPGKDGRPLSLRNCLSLGYFCGFLWYFGNCFWIYQTMYLYGGLPKPVSFGIVILFSLYLGLYHALFAGLFALVRKLRNGVGVALLLSPILWVAVELARAKITGFPWDLLGNVLVDNLLVTRIAPVLGVMGISFLVVALSAALAAGLMMKGRSRWILLNSSLLVIMLLQMVRLPWYWRDIYKSTETAVLLQENLSVGATGNDVEPLSVAREMDLFSQDSENPRSILGMSGETFFDLDGAPIHNPKLIVWPEAPSHFASVDPYFRSRLTALAQAENTPLVIGSLGIDMDRGAARGYNKYDSATLIDAQGNYAGRYDKIHLVPWGEYIPFQAFFSFAHKLTEGAGDMDRGHDRNVFKTGGHSYGVFICYESIFGDEVREFAKNGAEVFVNISDDGWYGETGAPWQHLNMARMRAIENRRWVLRSTNTGVTTSIDPLGRVNVEAPRHVRAAFAFPFGYEQETTFYTRHGDWFAYLCAVATLFAVAAGFSVKSKPLLN